MSIYRPDFQNTSVIIKRFGAITEDYSAVEWIGINGTYLRGISGTSHISFTPESTILIKCEIGAGATGPITGGLGGLRISVGSGTISWYNVTNGWVVDRTVGSGTHILGWMRYNGATYPYYDGIITDVSGETTPPRRRVYFGCFSQNNTAGGADSSDILSSSSATYAIKIYEVAGALAYNNEVVTPAHMYAALWGSTYRLFEARMGRGSDTVLTPHSSSASGGGSAVTYGVQLHDLKYAFSSPYHDLLAIICQDDGNPDSGADPADHIKKIGESETHDMAFRLAAGTGNNYTDPVMPFPSGYTINRSGSYPNNLDYEYGDLICGRHPKWNIWYDGMRHSMYVKTIEGIDHLKLNIFKDVNGNTNNEMLLRWDGYNNSNSAQHPPKFTLGNISADYNDSVPCLCRSNQNIISSQTAGRDIYCYDLGAQDIGAVCIGNLAPWYYTRAELANTHWGVYGAAITLDMYLYVSASFGWVTLYKQYEYGTENTYFSSQSSSDKTKFRDNYILPVGGRVLSDIVMRNIFNSLQWSNNQATSSARQSIALIGAPQGPSAPSDSDLIRTDFLIPAKSKTITFNKYNHNSAGVCVLGDMGSGNNRGVCLYVENHATTEYIIAVKGSAKQVQNNYVNYFAPGTGSCYCIGLPIGLYNPSTSSFMNLSGTMPIVAFMEYTIYVEGDYYAEYYGFTRPFCTYTDSSSQRTIDSPMTGTQWLNQRSMYFKTFDAVGGGTLQTVTEGGADSNGRFPNSAACLFRWPDLIHRDGEQAPSSGYRGMARLRVFNNIAASLGPIAWDIYEIGSMDHPQRVIMTSHEGSTNVGWSFAFKKQDRIIAYQSGSSFDVVRAYFTIYDNNMQQKCGSSFYRDKPVYIELYAMPLHSPLDITNDSVYSGLTSYVARFTIPAEDSSRGYKTDTNNGYTASMSGQIMGTSGMSPEQECDYEYGSYYLLINCDANSHSYSPGTMYVIKMHY